MFVTVRSVVSRPEHEDEGDSDDAMEEAYHRPSRGGRDDHPRDPRGHGDRHSDRSVEEISDHDHSPPPRHHERHHHHQAEHDEPSDAEESASSDDSSHSQEGSGTLQHLVYLTNRPVAM